MMDRLVALDLPPGDFAVHGSGALLLRGMVDTVTDLDVVARAAAWQRACELGPVEHGALDPVVRPRGDVEIWGGWLGDDIDALIGGAEIVEGWPCVRLAEVLAFKERLARPKDRRHIALLRAVLRS